MDPENQNKNTNSNPDTETPINSADPALHQNAPGYEQYLGVPQKKRKNKLIFIVLGIFALLIILTLIAAFALNSQDNTKTTPTSDNKIEVQCSDEKCFNTNFSDCFPTYYEEKDVAGTTFGYKIPGTKDIGCDVTVKYVSGPDPDLVNSEMTCDFDNQIDFKKSLINAYLYPDDYNCSGSLSEHFNQPAEGNI